MNKSIFKKLKKQINQNGQIDSTLYYYQNSPSGSGTGSMHSVNMSQQQSPSQISNFQNQYQNNAIINMSIQDIQKKLITNMSNQKQQTINPNSLNKQSYQINNLVSQYESTKNKQKSNSNQTKNLPQLMLQNDSLKQEIQKLKNQKKMIISKYEEITFVNSSNHNQKDQILEKDQFNIQNSNHEKQEIKSNYENNQVKYKNQQIPFSIKKQKTYQDRKNDQFSFKKTMQNIQNQSQKFIINLNAKRNENIFKVQSLDNSTNQLRSIYKPFQTKENQSQRRYRPVKNSVDSKHNLSSSFVNLNQSRHSGSKIKKSSAIMQQTAFSTLQQRFYQYCKTQMIRMNSQNIKLSLKIGQLENKLTTIFKENQLLISQNQKLNQLNKELQNKLKNENERINKINQDLFLSLRKKDQIFSTQFKLLQQRIKQLVSSEQKLKFLLLQKDQQIKLLKSQSISRYKQCQKCRQTINYNIYLKNELNQQFIKNKQLSQKFVKNSTIDHLWQIKQVQYDNLIEILNGEKKSIQQQIKGKNSKISQRNVNKTWNDNIKQDFNALEMSFSQNSRHKI